MSLRPKKNHGSSKNKRTGSKNIHGKGSRVNKTELGSLRIIGGTWGSRRLSFPVLDGLRPTTDRVKETVFNWLTPYIEGARVLDLFAGSGSLGFEALSRGAATLTSIEMDKLAAKAIESNLEILDKQVAAQQADVINTDALQWLEAKNSMLSEVKTNDRYDIVFIDPPFRKGLLNNCLKQLSQKAVLNKGAIIYLEREKEATNIELPPSWILIKEKVAGQVCYQLYKVAI